MFIWWILWANLTAGFLLVYLFLKREALPAPDQASEIVPYVVTVLLFLSCVVRWLVLPRMTLRRKALPVFVAGMALAEGSGLLGIFLGGANRDTLFALAVVGLLQYAPVFVGKLEA